MGIWLRNFAKRLQVWQRRAGWSSIQLAARAGLSRNYLTRLKQGVVNPSLKVVCQLAQAFGRDPGELVGTPKKDRRIERLFNTCGGLRTCSRS